MWARQDPRAIGTTDLPDLRSESNRGNDLAALRICGSGSEFHRPGDRLWVVEIAVLFAAQSATNGRHDTRPGFQHRSQLRHQYQLAELWWRSDARLPRADARPGSAELP